MIKARVQVGWGFAGGGWQVYSTMSRRGIASADGFVSSSLGSSSSRSERLERLLEGDSVGKALTSGVLCDWKRIGERSAGSATGA